MTLNFLDWAFNAPVETPAELAVLLVIASRAHQDGHFAMDRHELAEKTRVRADKLDQVIENLEDLGLVSTFNPRDWSKIGVFLKVDQ